MKVTFDSKNDVMRIRFQEGKYEVSKEVDEGIIIDRAKDNKIIAIEILDASERLPATEIKKVAVGSSQ